MTTTHWQTEGYSGITDEQHTHEHAIDDIRHAHGILCSACKNSAADEYGYFRSDPGGHIVDLCSSCADRLNETHDFVYQGMH